MGKHLLLEVYDVNFDLINDVESLQNVMIRGIERAKMTVLNVFSHCFIPQGCTVVIALAESHVSCHTWPENGCLAKYDKKHDFLQVQSRLYILVV